MTEASAATTLSASTMKSLGLSVHEKVVVSGKIGILRYCGSTDFASGQWAGIELQDPLGRNDGTIGGRSYFKCAPLHGIFAPLTRVTPYRESKLPTEYKPMGSSMFTRGYSDEGPVPTFPQYSNEISIEKTRIRTTSLGSSRSATLRSSESLFDVKIDDRVMVCGQKIGVTRYVGPTTFAPGIWVGVELLRPDGKNDGTVAGFRYFTCNPKYGIFAPLLKVQRISEAAFDERVRTNGNDRLIGNINPQSMHASNINHTSKHSKSEQTNTGLNTTSTKPSGGTPKNTKNKSIPTLCREKERPECKSISDDVFEDDGDILGEWSLSGTEGKENTFDDRLTPNVAQNTNNKTRNTSTPTSRRGSPQTQLEPTRPNQCESSRCVRSRCGCSESDGSDLGKELNFRLQPGTLVYHNNELATLRYIGDVDFADGIWLGIELRKPGGKNDGKVGSRRYFACPPNHGLMVRPNRTWCHGINCAKLIGPESVPY